MWRQIFPVGRGCISAPRRQNLYSTALFDVLAFLRFCVEGRRLEFSDLAAANDVGGSAKCEPRGSHRRRLDPVGSCKSEKPIKDSAVLSVCYGA
jgi:hypothetical protein